MRASFAAILILLSGSIAPAEDWGEEMFDHFSHDFGVVARGQEVEYRFPLENIYVEDVQIGTITSSCTCTTPKASKQRLKMYDEGAIVATVDTRNFLGRKQATLTVKMKVMTEPEPCEDKVQLHCYVHIRTDVVLEPGTVRLGSAPYGTGIDPKEISITYAGRENWKITGVECDNPHLDVKLKETGRQIDPVSQVAQVSYSLSVGLKAGSPVGYIRDHIMLITNDANPDASKVAVAVEGNVASSVSVKPSPLLLGLLKPGEKKSKHLVVKGETPFRVLGVSGPGNHFQFTPTESVKPLHVIPLIYTAPDSPGKISGAITIKTDVTGNESVEVQFDGQVIDASGT